MENGFFFSLEVILYADNTTEELPCCARIVATLRWYSASSSGLLSIKENVYFWH